jgi:hypothetical protein
VKFQATQEYTLAGCYRYQIQHVNKPSIYAMAIQPKSGLGLGFLTTQEFTQTAGLSWTSDHPVARPLPTQDKTTYKHKRQTSMPRVGFEPAIPATKQPQTYALDRAATGIGYVNKQLYLISKIFLHIKLF